MTGGRTRDAASRYEHLSRAGLACRVAANAASAVTKAIAGTLTRGTALPRIPKCRRTGLSPRKEGQHHQSESNNRTNACCAPMKQRFRRHTGSSPSRLRDLHPGFYSYRLRSRHSSESLPRYNPDDNTADNVADWILSRQRGVGSRI